MKALYSQILKQFEASLLTTTQAMEKLTFVLQDYMAPYFIEPKRFILYRGNWFVFTHRGFIRWELLGDVIWDVKEGEYAHQG